MAVYIPDTGNLQLNLALEQLANNVTTTQANVGNAVTIDGNTIISPGGEILGYLNRYIVVNFATDGYGSNSSPIDTNRSYYGILNQDNTNVANLNPLSFAYTQVAGGFGLTRNLYYKTTGGRNIQWDVNTAPINTEWLPTNPGNSYVPIDLDVITGAQGGTGSNGYSTFAAIVYQANTVQPAAPTGGTYQFTATPVFVPPTNWVANIPNVTTQNVYAAQFTFSSNVPNATVTGGNWAVSNVIYRVPSNGANATSVYNYPVYIRQATAPGTPVANTGYYNFGTGTYGPPTGNSAGQVWSTNPVTGTDQQWVSYAIASAIGQGNANTLTWSTPTQLAQTGSQGPAGANGQTNFIGVVYQANNSQPNNITTQGFYNFSTNTLTPPAGWSATLPTNAGGFPIYASQASFITTNSIANIANTTSWTPPALAYQSGNAGPAGTRGFVPLAYVVTALDPTGFSNAQFTSAFSSPRTNTNPPIGTGYTPITGDTAQFYWKNPSVGGADSRVVRYYDGSGWQSAVGQVIDGNLVVTGTITSTQMNTNSIYALKIQGGSVANVNDVGNVGYFLDAPSGDALFTGNLRIGDRLRVGNNAIIGNSLTVGNNFILGNTGTVGNNFIIGNSLIVGSNAIIGANLVVGNNFALGNNGQVGNNFAIGNSLTVGNNAIIGANLTVGNNAVIGNNVSIGANLNVAGLINGGNLAANTVGTTQLQPGVIPGGAGPITQLTSFNLTGNTVGGGWDGITAFFQTSYNYAYKRIGFCALNLPTGFAGNASATAITFTVDWRATITGSWLQTFNFDPLSPIFYVAVQQGTTSPTSTASTGDRRFQLITSGTANSYNNTYTGRYSVGLGGSLFSSTQQNYFTLYFAGLPVSGLGSSASFSFTNITLSATY